MTAALIPISFMSFNISSGQTVDGRLDLELTASAIEKGSVDIVGLQEVDQNFSERTNFFDQVKWLENRLGMDAAFGPNLTGHPGTADWPLQAYGNAILSRYPIKSYRNHLFENVGPEKESEQRGLLEAFIEIRGTTIVFFTTHLSLRKEQLERNIEQMMEIIRKTDYPAVLTGDFNTGPDSPLVKKVEKELDNVFGSAASHPATYKKQGEHGQKIDYVFCSRHWDVLHAEIIATQASDHRPILSVLQLKPQD
ncbi:endonuclease/exonuclease/phosphatase family protein [Planococcus sp. CAU13]|uniref:endonuclease/exonuclease/phosphatase family protein n=1 Tax=Planococcus sp. CAU13 TaxID=1541197 RepID=UPI0006905228|nr:endonuclease/exonuclease/phosphatase family protein [Planococcus sp. CAU13]